MSFKRVRLMLAARAVGQGCLEQQPGFLGILASQDLANARQHLIRRDIGKKTKSAAIYAEQGHIVAMRNGSGIKHGSVAADGDDQVGNRSNLFFRHLARRQVRWRIRRSENVYAGFCQIAGEHSHGFCHPPIFAAAE